jgi:hypothetical protein
LENGAGKLHVQRLYQQPKQENTKDGDDDVDSHRFFGKHVQLVQQIRHKQDIYDVDNTERKK